jgi:hypothetical protein
MARVLQCVGVARLRLERRRHDVLHLRIADRARRARAWVIEQSIQSLREEPAAPLPYRLLRHAQLPGDARVRLVHCAPENHARAQREGLGRRRPPRPAFQRLALVVGQRQGWDRSANAHERSPFYGKNTQRVYVVPTFQTHDTSRPVKIRKPDEVIE